MLEMFEDSSKRTKQISNNAITIAVCIIISILSIFFVFIGTLKYSGMVARSSSPVGTEMTFTRSNAKVKISGLYTDKSKSALVIRISPEDDAQTKLPFKGTDYKVYLTSKSLDGYKEADIIFGKISTDGDMFLVIPKPSDEIYNVFIMNTKYLAVDNITTKQGAKRQNDDASNIQDLDEGAENNLKTSISKAISSYKYDPSGKNAKEFVVDDNHSDVISFRVTTNPALEDEAHKPIVLDTQLVTDGKEFDFKSFFNIVFKQSVVNTLEKQYEANKSTVLQVEEALKEAKERVSQNAQDADAVRAVEKLTNELEILQREQANLANKHSQYSNLQFANSMFSNLQTKATVVDTNWKGK